MQHRNFKPLPTPLVLGCIALATTASAQSLPPDVRTGHWAAAPVQSVLRNNILNLQPDKAFHGDAKITHTQAVIALARLGRTLEAHTWQSSPSIPIAFTKTHASPKSGPWETQGISRYVFAAAVARLGDYADNGIVRAKPDEKETGKSTVIQAPAAVKISKTNPAYEALTYLASHRMITPGSKLLTPDDKPLTAAEMTRALKDLMIGLNDRVTDIGHDADGNTHDEAFHTKKPTR